ncbi:MAG TPA: DUF1697 domain-containing protein [Saprospiraceae bacterium]|nr:DUF1697 domain-containing protein [Saprospiraceae bacterium]
MQYIAIIRGINVGGHNNVNMKVLREALEHAGFKDVRTYIQSGNVILRSHLRKIESIETSLSKLLKASFDVNVPVIVRNEQEWERTVKRNSYLKSTDDHTKLLVTFLSETPSSADVKATSLFRFPHDEFVIDGKDIYLFCKDGYGKSDIPNTFFEKHLKVTGTTRNWRTVLEVSSMLHV